MGTLTQLDDKVPAFSPWPKRGATRGVDLVAPGSAHPGPPGPGARTSTRTIPEGQLGADYFRGSGTSSRPRSSRARRPWSSRSTPARRPDQVKKLLTSDRVAISGKSQAIGGGELQLDDDPHAGHAELDPDVAVLDRHGQPRAVARHRPPDPRRRRAERRAGHLRPAFDSAAMAALEASGSSWSGGTWNGNSWSGSSWSGNSWSGNSWSGNSWSGNSWSGNSWSGNSLVRQQLERQLLVRQQLVDGGLGLAATAVASGGSTPSSYTPVMTREPSHRRARPLRIGITGPIGCGKSTVAGWLGERPGVVVIDADVRWPARSSNPASRRSTRSSPGSVRAAPRRRSLDRAALGRRSSPTGRARATSRRSSIPPSGRGSWRRSTGGGRDGRAGGRHRGDQARRGRPGRDLRRGLAGHLRPGGPAGAPRRSRRPGRRRRPADRRPRPASTSGSGRTATRVIDTSARETRAIVDARSMLVGASAALPTDATGRHAADRGPAATAV